MSIYQNAQLLLSVAAPSQFPADLGAEVAIAGRSNAGKSSAINAITGRRALARTSKLPGRTRLLNFFELLPQARLIDLPGYGYAEGPRAHREDWARLIEALAPRRSLKGLLLVVDARRGVQDSDEQLLAWAQLHQRPVHVLLSKADQLRRSEARQLLASVQARLAARAAVQLFSARDGTGVDEARSRLASWLAEAGQEKAPAVQ
ncbi:MAG: ribosome biogenesis GTP-binding protein YihA/YsxC [Steroidobacteraceae bacterium]